MYIGRKGKWKSHVLIASEINMLNLNIPEQRVSSAMSDHRYFVLTHFFPQLWIHQQLISRPLYLWF